MKPQPVEFTWTGGVMRPLPRFHNIAARLYGEEGSLHTLVQTDYRSAASHRHYFAALHDAWMNLPEDEAKHYPSVEHFRMRLLILAGYSDDRHIACKDHAMAVITAALIRDLDAYAVISVSDNVVLVRRAKSQALGAMNKEEFEKSKRDVLDYAASMIGVRVGELRKNAGRSA